MKILRNFFRLGMCILLFMSCSKVKPVSLNVVSFNIRYDNPDDSLNNWKYRKDQVVMMIRECDADVIGTQEVLNNQMNDMKNMLPEYHTIGVGREDGKEKGEYSALFYKKDRFEEVCSGWFWLSENPEIAGSRGWDGACERIATWAVLREKISSKEFFILNTHLDHVGVVARREGISLIMKRIQDQAGDRPVIITGDFNALPESDVIAQITGVGKEFSLLDSRSIAETVEGPNWTFHDFGKIPVEKRPLIDYIFVNGKVKVNRYKVLPEKVQNQFVSDHCAIFANVQL